MTKYLSCADTAKLIRKQLKELYPGVKFSVRSSVYAGGASIQVKWTDGPNYTEVNDLLKYYEGKRFDGMIDYGFYVKHWMTPDGCVHMAKSEGSACTGGVYHGYDHDKPHPDAELVSMGADYVFAEREVSLHHKVKAADKILAEWKNDCNEEINQDNYYDLSSVTRVGGDHGPWLNQAVHQELVNKNL